MKSENIASQVANVKRIVRHPDNKELEILYRRQCEYSDYLDELQRSSQRYYFVALGGSIGIFATLFN